MYISNVNCLVCTVIGMALQVDREEALRNQRNTITGCYNSKNPPNKPRYKYNSLPTRNLDARESSVHVSEDREPLHSFTDIEVK